MPMHDAHVAPAPIPQMTPLAFEQIIIAGGDDDVSAADLFDWVAPLLAGIPGGRWMSCEIDADHAGNVFANYRDGASNRMVGVRLDAAAPAVRALMEHLPDAGPLAVILLSDFSSQAVMLLDGIARWLNIYDTDDACLAPVLRLLGSFQSVLGMVSRPAGSDRIPGR